jgi:hypothetical protein
VRALDDDALQLVESSIIPNLKAWGCASFALCATLLPHALDHQAHSRRMMEVFSLPAVAFHPPYSNMFFS